MVRFDATANRKCRSASWLLAAAVLLAFSACGAATMATKSELEGKSGSCEVACDHYEHCKDERDSAREGACISECRAIFSEDGFVDNESLYELESLSCRQLLLFIEGTGARPPGSPET